MSAIRVHAWSASVRTNFQGSNGLLPGYVEVYFEFKIVCLLQMAQLEATQSCWVLLRCSDSPSSSSPTPQLSVGAACGKIVGVHDDSYTVALWVQSRPWIKVVAPHSVVSPNTGSDRNALLAAAMTTVDMQQAAPVVQSVHYRELNGWTPLIQGVHPSELPPQLPEQPAQPAMSQPVAASRSVHSAPGQLRRHAAVSSSSAAPLHPTKRQWSLAASASEDDDDQEEVEVKPAPKAVRVVSFVPY